MSYRPYPNAARALRNLRHQQAVYLYGRVPQRYALGLVDGVTGEMGTPVGAYVLSTRRPRVVGPAS